jgi:hypothetical protein
VREAQPPTFAARCLSEGPDVQSFAPFACPQQHRLDIADSVEQLIG